MSNGYDYIQLIFVSTRSLTLESTTINHNCFSPIIVYECDVLHNNGCGHIL